MAWKRMAALMAAAMLVAGPAYGAGLAGVWNGAAREPTGKTYLFVLTLWSEGEGVVDYKALKCRSLVKAVPNAAVKKLFREIVVEGAFSGQCDNGFFELKPQGEQLRWIW